MPVAHVSAIASKLIDAVQLPSCDVRGVLDDSARRGWGESSRRFARVVGLIAGDTCAGLLGVYVSLWTWSLVSAAGSRPMPDDVPLVAMVLCLQPLALMVVGAYSGGRYRLDLVRLAGGIAVAALIGWLQGRIFGHGTDVPNKTAYLYASLWILSYVWLGRLLFDRLVTASYRRGFFQRRVLAIGSADDAAAFQMRYGQVHSEIRIVGRLAFDPDDIRSRSGESLHAIGTVDDLHDAMTATSAQGVVLVADTSLNQMERLAEQCLELGASLTVWPRALQPLSSLHMEMRHSAAGDFMQLNPLQLQLPQLATKRAMDVLFTVLGLLLIWPVLLAVAIAVKLDSPGPVLFRQRRAGVGGRPFEILKFRTMVANADALKASLQHLNEYPDARLFKIKKDPRITRIGGFLRKSSLDELPQLWNVLCGDMSLVGPRPCVPEELAHYAPHHLERLFVVPGLTGPWQVSGRNDVTDFEEVVRMDREYIRSWSLTRDLSILLKTIPVVLGRGAY